MHAYLVGLGNRRGFGWVAPRDSGRIHPRQPASKQYIRPEEIELIPCTCHHG